MALSLVTFLMMALAIGGLAIGAMFDRSLVVGKVGKVGRLNAVDGSAACQSCSRQLAQLFIDSPCRRYPVLQNDRLAGQVSRRDVL